MEQLSVCENFAAATLRFALAPFHRKSRQNTCRPSCSYSSSGSILPRHSPGREKNTSASLANELRAWRALVGRKSFELFFQHLRQQVGEQLFSRLSNIEQSPSCVWA